MQRDLIRSWAEWHLNLTVWSFVIRSLQIGTEVFHSPQLTLHETSPPHWQKLVFFHLSRLHNSKVLSEDSLIIHTTFINQPQLYLLGKLQVMGELRQSKGCYLPRVRQRIGSQARPADPRLLPQSTSLVVGYGRVTADLTPTALGHFSAAAETTEEYPGATMFYLQVWTLLMLYIFPRRHLLPVLDKVTGSTWQTMIKPSHFVTVCHWPWQLGLERSSRVSTGSPGKASFVLWLLPSRYSLYIWLIIRWTAPYWASPRKTLNFKVEFASAGDKTVFTTITGI